MEKIRVLHYLNQFFGGRGGEDKTGLPLEVVAGPVGPARLLDRILGDEGGVVATAICGDDAFNRDPARNAADVVEAAIDARASLIVAGPAFGAGRYGLACARVCHHAVEERGVPALTAMHPENPGVPLYRSTVVIVPTGADAAQMVNVLERLARLGVKMARGAPLGRPVDEGYLPRGIKRNVLRPERGAARAVEMLVSKLAGRPYATEIPLPAFPPVPPAPPIRNLAAARIALVTTGGVVPRGNPDRLESRFASRCHRYDISDRSTASPTEFECIHGGFDNELVNRDPNLVVPLDALRVLEREGSLGGLYSTYFATTGNGAHVPVAIGFAEGIVEELRAAGVAGVLMTVT